MSDRSSRSDLLAHSGDDKTRYALAVVPDVYFRTYEVEFRLQPIKRLTADGSGSGSGSGGAVSARPVSG